MPMRFARSAGYLDWDNQPDPFRRFEGAETLLLPLNRADDGPAYDDLYIHDGAVRRPLDAASLGRFFELSLGITAWKSYQSATWALRANPSSGNLHPTECYCIIPENAGAGGTPGVFHYRSDLHALERRRSMERGTFDALLAPFGRAGFFVALTSIHWRESWKYGERAYRYCQHDAGHAIGSLRFAAKCLGWRLAALPNVSDAEIEDLCGLNRGADFKEAEREAPDLLAFVDAGAPADAEIATDAALDENVISQIRAARWSGTANRLSADRIEWEVIDGASAAARRGKLQIRIPPAGARAAAEARVDDNDLPRAARVIRARRSATAYDSKTTISRERFLQILARTHPRPGEPPFDAIEGLTTGGAAAHLAIFVHRVDGLERGLYLCIRNPAAADRLRGAMRPAFDWRRVDSPFDYLQLYLLKSGDMTAIGPAVSCNQDIAGQGTFSLGMICEFEPRIRRDGAHVYRYIHWEAGLVGQALYLECEAAGIRGTGIGCFYDDEMHGFLGLRGRDFQTIYHFAAGGPVDDARLQIKPAYPEDRYRSTESGFT